MCTTARNTTGAEGHYTRAELFNIPRMRRGNPHYYTITPVEHCTDAALTTCTAATAPTGGFTFPAPLRYCSNPFDAVPLGHALRQEPTNTKVRCRKKYEEETGYIYPRYGQFTRVDITSATGTYGSRPLRTDCAARPNCSYSEEMTNFANWFAYYRTRMLSMKTAAGLAFSPIDSRYRVGFLTINPGDPVDDDTYLKIDTFTPAHKKAWYEKFYDKNNPGGGTPLPEALSRAGRHFAGARDGINKGMNDDPMQYSCQQNFTILTTDGYWSGYNGDKIDGSSDGNQDHISSSAPRPVRNGATDGGAQDPDGSGRTYRLAARLPTSRCTTTGPTCVRTARSARSAPTCRRTTCRPARTRLRPPPA